MIALAEQRRTPHVPPLDAVVGGRMPADVFSAGMRLRAAGWRVRLAAGRIGVALVREADEFGALEALEVDGDVIARVDRAGEGVMPLGDPLPAPPRETWAARGGDAG